MPFEQLDSSLIASFGEDVEYTPYGGAPETVRVNKVDPLTRGAIGALAMVFGTIADSGFSQKPVKGDSFEIDGETYRVFEVQGPDGIGGIYISLTK